MLRRSTAPVVPCPTLARHCQPTSRGLSCVDAFPYQRHPEGGGSAGLVGTLWGLSGRRHSGAMGSGPCLVAPRARVQCGSIRPKISRFWLLVRCGLVTHTGQATSSTTSRRGSSSTRVERKLRGMAHAATPSCEHSPNSRNCDTPISSYGAPYSTPLRASCAGFVRYTQGPESSGDSACIVSRRRAWSP